MGQLVVTGGSATCTFGVSPATVNVTSQAMVLGGTMPAGTIQDCQMVNLPTFGMCSSMSNPQVASATAAAMGVLTPMPCVPVAAGTWISTNATVLINNKPCLTSDCKLTCAYGGSISIVSPGQTKVTIG